MITSLIRPPKKSIFGIHDPKGIKFIFQLRLGLSPLKSHKKRHNFSDTPSDWCDCLSAPEDRSHFILHCTKFNSGRLKLLNDVNVILNIYNLSILANNFEVFLYGHHTFSTNNNRSIILATISFIKDTGRFS